MVVATLGAGLIIVDNNGRVIKQLSTKTGFPDNSQNYLKVSRYGGLWVALDNEGVAYLDDDLVKLTYDRNQGISGYINEIKQIDRKIFVATGAGVFASQSENMVGSSGKFFYSKDSNMSDFFQVSEQPNVWLLEKYQGDLFIASESGVFRRDWTALESGFQRCEIPVDEGRQLAVQAFSFAVDTNKDVLIIGLEDGLAVYNPSHGDSSCQLQRLDLGMETFEVRSIEIQNDKLYLGTAYDGFVVVSGYDYESGSVENVAFSSEHPPGRNDVVKWGDRLFGVNSNGVLGITMSEGGERIRLLKDLDIPEFQNVSVMSTMSNGTGWLVTSDRLIQLRQKLNGIQDSRTPESMKFEKSSTSSILVDSTGVVWFNNGSELIRYDPRYDVPGNKVFNAHIAQVTQNSTGEVLFHGVHRADNGGIALKQPDWSIPILDYEEKNLSFRFSATEFINPEAVQYRYRIIGADKDEWSEWSLESEVMTPSLKEGQYSIAVQAKDEIGRLSEASAYSFVILPPWYRTAWAYIGYLLFAIAAIISARKYFLMRRSHKLAAEQAKELEREREVVKKLSEANDRLKQANKLKDEFLATTSHELRTPLTAILGFTSVLKDEIPEDAEYREFLDIIEDSGGRLMETLNSLLDLAKLRAGIMEINLEALNLYQATYQEVVQFQEAASRKGLKLRVERPQESYYAMADMHGLSRVLHNLVGNAIKFTDEGEVCVSFGKSVQGVELRIQDTGIGIEAKFLPELFNAFIQESDGLSRTHEGTGLGLAITSGIVQLMGASIRVESEKGMGSTFIVELQAAEAPRQMPRRILGMGDTARA